MALNFYCGSPGAGKSYHVVRYVIIGALKDGRNVLTNLPVKMDSILEAYPDLKNQDNELRMIENDKVKNIHRIVDSQEYAGWVLVIDEAHDFWPSEETIRDPDFKSWLSQHRHKLQDVIMITQDFENMSKYIRRLTKERFEFEKNDVRGSANSYMQDHFLKQSKKRTKREIHKYAAEFFEYYYSHDIGLAGSGFKEQRTGKKMNLMRKPVVMAIGGVGLALICIFLLFYSIGGSVGHAGETSQNEVNNRLTIDPIKDSIVPVDSGFSESLANSNELGYLPIKTPDIWCKNVSRSSAGVGGMDISGNKFIPVEVNSHVGIYGLTSFGGNIQLKGAYKVIGAIIIPKKAIYILRASDKDIYKIKLEENIYTVGQKICF